MDCDKKAFDSKIDAQKRLVEIKKEEGGNKKPKRVYYCPKCEKYHLTSWTNNKKSTVDFFRSEAKNRKLEIEAEYWERRLR
jgi:hypothetical protein